MGLFSNVKDEIDELFADCCDTSRNGYNLKAEIGSIIILGRGDTPIREVDDSVMAAYDLLATGLYSTLQISRQCGAGFDEVNELLRRNPFLTCPCGKLLSAHQGRCKNRIRKKHDLLFVKLAEIRGQEIGNTINILN